MHKDVTKHSTMLELQGDQVLVIIPDQSYVLTIVRLMDVSKQSLLLVDRSDKKDKPSFELTQAILEAMVPYKGDPKLKDPGNVKWKLTI